MTDITFAVHKMLYDGWTIADIAEDLDRSVAWVTRLLRRAGGANSLHRLRNQRALLRELAHHPERAEGLAWLVGISPKTARRRLRELVAMGEVSAEKVGKTVIYSLVPHE